MERFAKAAYYFSHVRKGSILYVWQGSECASGLHNIIDALQRGVKNVPIEGDWAQITWGSKSPNIRGKELSPEFTWILCEINIIRSQTKTSYNFSYSQGKKKKTILGNSFKFPAKVRKQAPLFLQSAIKRAMSPLTLSLIWSIRIKAAINNIVPNSTPPICKSILLGVTNNFVIHLNREILVITDTCVQSIHSCTNWSIYTTITLH